MESPVTDDHKTSKCERQHYLYPDGNLYPTSQTQRRSARSLDQFSHSGNLFHSHASIEDGCTTPRHYTAGCVE